MLGYVQALGQRWENRGEPMVQDVKCSHDIAPASWILFCPAIKTLRSLKSKRSSLLQLILPFPRETADISIYLTFCALILQKYPTQGCDLSEP